MSSDFTNCINTFIYSETKFNSFELSELVTKFVNCILCSYTLKTLTWTFIYCALRTRGLRLGRYAPLFQMTRKLFWVVIIYWLFLFWLEEAFEKRGNGLHYLFTLAWFFIIILELIVRMPSLFCSIVIISEFIRIIVVGCSILVGDQAFVFSRSPLSGIATHLFLLLCTFQFEGVICALSFVIVRIVILGLLSVYRRF